MNITAEKLEDEPCALDDVVGQHPRRDARLRRIAKATSSRPLRLIPQGGIFTSLMDNYKDTEMRSMVLLHGEIEYLSSQNYGCYTQYSYMQAHFICIRFVAQT